MEELANGVYYQSYVSCQLQNDISFNFQVFQRVSQSISETIENSNANDLENVSISFFEQANRSLQIITVQFTLKQNDFLF